MTSWPPNPKRYAILRTDRDDQPPEHDPALPWLVLHPTGIEGARRRESRFPTYDDALRFVLSTPEVRRRTRRTRTL